MLGLSTDVDTNSQPSIFKLAIMYNCRVKWISIDGVMVKPSCVLLKETGDFPAFLQVQNIFVTCTDVFMQGP